MDFLPLPFEFQSGDDVRYRSLCGLLSFQNIVVNIHSFTGMTYIYKYAFRYFDDDGSRCLYANKVIYVCIRINVFHCRTRTKTADDHHREGPVRLYVPGNQSWLLWTMYRYFRIDVVLFAIYFFHQSNHLIKSNDDVQIRSVISFHRKVTLSFLVAGHNLNVIAMEINNNNNNYVSPKSIVWRYMLRFYLWESIEIFRVYCFFFYAKAYTGRRPNSKLSFIEL